MEVGRTENELRNRKIVSVFTEYGLYDAWVITESTVYPLFAREAGVYIDDPSRWAGLGRGIFGIARLVGGVPLETTNNESTAMESRP